MTSVGPPDEDERKPRDRQPLFDQRTFLIVLLSAAIAIIAGFSAGAAAYSSSTLPDGLRIVAAVAAGITAAVVAFLGTAAALDKMLD